jgi:hypothetical protein
VDADDKRGADRQFHEWTPSFDQKLNGERMPHGAGKFNSEMGEAGGKSDGGGGREQRKEKNEKRNLAKIEVRKEKRDE